MARVSREPARAVARSRSNRSSRFAQPPFELLLGLEQLLVLLGQRQEEPGVVDGHSGLRAECEQGRLVLGAELLALELVQHLDHADGSTQVVLQRRNQHVPRAITGQDVPLGLEALVGVGVLDPDRLAGLGHTAGDAVAHLQPDGAHLLPHHDAAQELAVLLVQQVQRGAVRLEQLGDLAQDELQQIVEVERGTERVADLPQRPRDALLAGQSHFQLPHAALQLRGPGFGWGHASIETRTGPRIHRPPVAERARVR